MSHYELLNKRKPNLCGLEPFGVPCTFLKVRDQPKFAEKAEEGLFLGYISGTPNYRVYNVKDEIVDMGYNVVITNHTPPIHKGSSLIFDYDDVFTSFNGPIAFGVGTSSNDDIVISSSKEDGAVNELPSTSDTVTPSNKDSEKEVNVDKPIVETESVPILDAVVNTPESEPVTPVSVTPPKCGIKGVNNLELS